jgi:hypothetical protein
VRARRRRRRRRRAPSDSRGLLGGGLSVGKGSGKPENRLDKRLRQCNDATMQRCLTPRSPQHAAAQREGCQHAVASLVPK